MNRYFLNPFSMFSSNFQSSQSTLAKCELGSRTFTSSLISFISEVRILGSFRLVLTDFWIFFLWGGGETQHTDGHSKGEDLKQVSEFIASLSLLLRGPSSHCLVFQKKRRVFSTSKSSPFHGVFLIVETSHVVLVVGGGHRCSDDGATS